MLEETIQRPIQEDETSQILCGNLNDDFKMMLEGENLTIPFEAVKIMASKQASKRKYLHYKR